MNVTDIYQRHADFVWTNLGRMGVRPADVPDMLQEVFVVVHRRLDSFDGRSQMTSWLYGICLRVASGYRRRAHVRLETPTESPREPTHERTPETTLIARDRRDELHRLLDTLEVDKRAVLVMHEFEELSCAAIAAELEVPVGTVYSRLHHARAALRRAWERSHPEDRARPAPTWGAA